MFITFELCGAAGVRSNEELAGSARRERTDMDQETHEAPPPIAWASDALRDVAAERRRQIEAEGWAPEHDDEHGTGGMAIAAACYALADHQRALEVQTLRIGVLWAWTGWSDAWFKPKDARSNLVRAGALIVAEIERLDRAAVKPNAELSGASSTGG